MILTFTFGLLSGCIISAAADENWGYANEPGVYEWYKNGCCGNGVIKFTCYQYKVCQVYPGPSNWSRVFPYCNGTKQSPINIDNSSVEIDGTLTAIQLGDQWDVHLKQGVVNATLKNNGHTVVVVFTADGNLENSPILTTQGDKTWRLIQFHLHWGNDGNNGSEHTIDGMAYPAEIHFVHMKSTFTDVATAVTTEGGLMVMGFFFKVVNSLPQEVPLLTYIFDALQNVTYKGQEVKLDLSNFKLNAFMAGANLGTYYHYMGSLTTPKCEQTVTWNVMSPMYAIPVTEAQMSRLRSLKSTIENATNIKTMSGNFRPVQMLHGRKVKYANVGTSGDAAMAVDSSLMSTVLPIFLAFSKVLMH